MRLGLAGIVVSAALSVACTRAPSPLYPVGPTEVGAAASLGTTSKGSLEGGVAIANTGDTRWLRNNGRHDGIPRFVHAIERAGRAVARARPGSVLVTGDLSQPGGGRISHHASHASGRDADLLLYLQTLDGAPIAQSPGFLSFDADGLAWDRFHGRYVRFDVAREWLLVKSLLEDDQARVQWIFISDVLKAIVMEWARASGDSADTVLRAEEVMHQPQFSEPHDDHIHLRTGCTDAEVAAGCQQTGPERDFWAPPPPPPADTDVDLVMAIAAPLDGAKATSFSP